MTTSKETWKALERRLCRKLGGRRTPLSGSNSQHGTSADCIETKYPWLYIEIRMRKSFLHHNIFRCIEKQTNDKISILFTHTEKDNNNLVVMRLEDFMDTIKNEKGKNYKSANK